MRHKITRKQSRLILFLVVFWAMFAVYVRDNIRCGTYTSRTTWYIMRDDQQIALSESIRDYDNSVGIIAFEVSVSYEGLIFPIVRAVSIDNHIYSDFRLADDEIAAARTQLSKLISPRSFVSVAKFYGDTTIESISSRQANESGAYLQGLIAALCVVPATAATCLLVVHIVSRINDMLLKSKRRSLRCCESCGYALGGLRDTVCPECGGKHNVHIV